MMRSFALVALVLLVATVCLAGADRGKEGEVRHFVSGHAAHRARDHPLGGAVVTRSPPRRNNKNRDDDSDDDDDKDHHHGRDRQQSKEGGNMQSSGEHHHHDHDGVGDDDDFVDDSFNWIENDRHLECRGCIANYDDGSMVWCVAGDGATDSDGTCVRADSPCDKSYTDISECPTDAPSTKKSCSLCVWDQWVWCQDNSAEFDEYAGYCVDPSTHPCMSTSKMLYSLDSCANLQNTVGRGDWQHIMSVFFLGCLAVSISLCGCCIYKCQSDRRRTRQALALQHMRGGNLPVVTRAGAYQAVPVQPQMRAGQPNRQYVMAAVPVAQSQPNVDPRSSLNFYNGNANGGEYATPPQQQQQDNNQPGSRSGSVSMYPNLA